MEDLNIKEDKINPVVENQLLRPIIERKKETVEGTTNILIYLQ